MGVYAHVDRSIEMDRRFDRAKMAADTVRSNFIKGYALYDNKLHDSEVYQAQLLEDFQAAITEHQFVIHYQPKFDVRPEIPVLASAEALVRWQHPQLGMISPGVFIPLFEENGLIQQLDLYVWREAASQIRKWKEKFDISVPVSVNVSRIDMYDPNLIGTFQGLLDEFALTPGEILLEITESAYTQDSNQIISTVNRLRDIGFRIEMDDFGTGYSSLNMISSLPIDALKLDMKFIRNAFRDGRDTRLIEVIIDIADYLNVPVIAEGVETEEQLEALRAMGCDIVQGYYFSKPVPAEEYELFMEQRRQQDIENEESAADIAEIMQPEKAVSTSIVHALTSGYEAIYYVDTLTGQYVQFSAQGKYEDLQIERSGRDFFGDTQRNIPNTIYRDDRDRVALSMKKETLLTQLVGGRSFSMTYRLVIKGEPLYYNMRAVNADTRDNHHIVIGVSNVDEQIRQASESMEGVSDRNLEFFSIAQALSSDFESIYYVNLETNDYTEFTAQGSYEDLQIELSGTDFFTECQKNILSVVYEEDQDLVGRVMTKDTLLDILRGQQTYSVGYRLMIEGVPTYYQMKIVTAEDGNHLVIGVSNIDSQVAREQELESAQKNTLTFSSIAQALAADYFSIYYVNIDDDKFIEFSAHDDYDSLGIEKGGEDFFELSRKNILRVVHPEDHDKILTAFTKENLLHELESAGTFTLTYRLMFGDDPTYVSLKATRMSGDDGEHVVIGVNNIDAQMKRESELMAAREKANRDALTGVKSKHAYDESARRYNADITDGSSQPFAVVVCDVNELKTVNDTLGHQAGDRLILDASHRICEIFKHSPVFRIGGDEFAVLLRGSDYERRADLMAEMTSRNRKSLEGAGAVVACGMSEWQGNKRDLLENVFKRADSAMYENKIALKGK